MTDTVHRELDLPCSPSEAWEHVIDPSWLGDDGDLPLVDAAKWADTAVEMPSDLSSRALFDWLSPAAPKVDENGLLYLRDALAAMPIAVLVEDGVPRS